MSLAPRRPRAHTLVEVSDTAATPYEMIAIDLDGTLLGPGGVVSSANRAAVRRAREAGVTVLPCTGRGLAESRAVLEQIGHVGPVVTAGGAITACAESGRTLDRFALASDIIVHASAVFHEQGHAALVLKDRHAAGFDYLVLGGPAGHALDPIMAWWFEKLGVTARFAAETHDDEHPEHSVRVGLCAHAGEAVLIADRLRDELGERVMLHSFPAVVGPEHGVEPREIHVLEVFDAHTSKWAAITRLAEREGVDATRIAAIGDEVNDVSMVRAAACGVAMGNAVSEVMDVADRVAPSNGEDGVAFAIGRLLDGAW